MLPMYEEIDLPNHEFTKGPQTRTILLGTCGDAKLRLTFPRDASASPPSKRRMGLSIGIPVPVCRRFKHG